MAFSGFLHGLLCYRRAHRLIVDGLWRVVAIPGLIGVLYMPLILLFSYRKFPVFSNYLKTDILPDMLNFTAAVIALSAAVWLAGIVIGYVLYRNIVMLLFSPMLGYISERTEVALRFRETEEFCWQDVFPDIVRGVAMGALTLTASISLTIMAWALIVVPVMGALLSGLLLPLIQFYFSGWSFVDPTLERRRLSILDSFRFTCKNKGTVLGLGAGFTLILLVPILGWFLAPSYGIVAGTVCVNELERQEARTGDASKT